MDKGREIEWNLFNEKSIEQELKSQRDLVSGQISVLQNE